VSFASMGTVGKREGRRLRWAEEDEGKSESWTAASVRLAMSFAEVWPLAQRLLCLLSMRDPWCAPRYFIIRGLAGLL
jgi:hypothetical protein